LIGHTVKDCTKNRQFDLNNVPDKLPEEAWANMKKASDDKDIQEFREVLQSRSILIGPLLTLETGSSGLFKGCP